MINTVNTPIYYIWELLGINLKSSFSQGKNSFYIFNFYVYEMMDVHQTYCGKHIMMYLSLRITLYTLNLYSDMSIIFQ